MPLSTWPTAWPSVSGDIPTEAAQMRAVYAAVLERMHVAGISHNISAYGVPDSGLVRRTAWYAEMSEAIALLLPKFIDTTFDYATLGWDQWPRLLSQTAAAAQVAFPTGMLPSQGAPVVDYSGWLASAKGILDRMTMTMTPPAAPPYWFTFHEESIDNRGATVSAAAAAALAAPRFYTNVAPDPWAGHRFWEFGGYWGREYTAEFEYRELLYRHIRAIPAKPVLVTCIGFSFDFEMAVAPYFDALGTGLVEGLNLGSVVSASAGEVELLDSAPSAPDVLPTLPPLDDDLGTPHGFQTRIGFQLLMGLDYAHSSGFSFYTAP